ncbi:MULTISPECIES: DMT family transporter [Vibrio]|uniref:Permease of the drug/metabolite transporter (DMT) superfamily n=1 Tax=Vibrio coralliirubri TaxID=1516159 RepID=A0AA87C2J0_9VIBR|nr:MULTISPECIES: DMT family transporter [Vibrio]MBE8574237.1 EamA family transporter [Vibrio sp. OPT18]MCK8075408.1 DMT family transporter [Vibrio sp. 1CM2L]UPR32088.1 EamA family transporter [Vibrio crassostreae]CDT12132.1 putative Permease of the drug/metabolite transporter (DMT) superfamily [Vibrio coralliirubri]CDT31185.1 putative Permease of the drug/metabolite transporter (DMT) superfamily [Vibrio coralliirubri]
MNILLAMIPAFFWGTTYAVTQFTLQEWPPLLLGALRALPAGLLLLAVKPTLPKKGEWQIIFTLGLINIATFFGLIFVMALTLPSAISGVGMISVPVFAMIFHWVVKKQRPHLIQALSGIGLITLAWVLFNPSQIALNPIGLGAMFAAIMCIVIGSSITKSLGNRMHWWKVLTWQLILGGTILSVASGVHAFIDPQPYVNAVTHFDTRNAMGLVWVIGLNTALGYGMYVWLLQRMSVVDFTFGGIANPVAGIVTGMVLMGESFTAVQYSLMTGMIVMSLLPQLILAVRQSKQVKPVTQ